MADFASVEVDGIPVTLNLSKMGDFRTLRALAKAQKGDAIAISQFCADVFGDEQVDNIADSLAGDDGICLIGDVFTLACKAISLAAEQRGASAKN